MALRLAQAKEAPPIFLAPVLAISLFPTKFQYHFSTSITMCHRKRRDGNPDRGVSPLRRTGLRRPVGMLKEALPQPNLDPNRRSKITVDKNHGLWGFFDNDRKALSTPVEDSAHGMLRI